MRRKVSAVVNSVSPLIETTKIKNINSSSIFGTNNKLIDRLVDQKISTTTTVELPPLKKQYTVEERKAALFESATLNLSRSESFQKYGIPVRTQARDKNKLLALSNEKKIFGEDLQIRSFKDISERSKLETENSNAIVESIKQMNFTTSGPEKYIQDPQDVLLFQLAWDHRNDAGAGIGNHGMQSNVKAFLKDKSDDIKGKNGGSHTSESLRLEEAYVGRKYLKKVFRNPESNLYSKNDLSIFEKTPTLKKVSSISTMARKFLLSDQNLIEEMLLPQDGPSSKQIMNLDEIGFDPDGKHGRIFSMREKGEKSRKFIIKSGERSIFWASITLIISANGDLLMPIVTHQGGSETEMPAHFVMNLDEDFYVNCTPSGYSDKETFRIVAGVLNEYKKKKS